MRIRSLLISIDFDCFRVLFVVRFSKLKCLDTIRSKEAAEKEASEKEAAEKEVAEEDDDEEEDQQALPSGNSDDDSPVSCIQFSRVMRWLKCPICLMSYPSSERSEPKLPYVCLGC
jgi:hypothetical protein